MTSGDGLLVRVKPPLGCVTAAAARLLADAARKFGNGCIGLTNRGNLQIRGLSAKGVAPFAAEMVACGLASADPAVERRRRVIASPFAADLARVLESAIVADAGLDDLPDKFAVLAGAAGEADIVVIGDVLRIAGSDEAAAFCAAGPAVTAVAYAFLRLRRGEARMRDLVRSVGAAAVYRAAGLCVSGRVLPSVAMPGPGGVPPDMFAFALPLGQIGADAFGVVAAIAERFGDGVLRTTTERTLLLRGIADASGVRHALAGAGMITDEDDPRRLVSACAGRPRCDRSSVDTQADAALLPKLQGRRIHLSGCAKGCAHPGPTDITLVGRGGRYDVIIGGKASDAPIATHLTIRQAASVGWAALGSPRSVDCGGVQEPPSDREPRAMVGCEEQPTLRM